MFVLILFFFKLKKSAIKDMTNKLKLNNDMITFSIFLYFINETQIKRS